MTGQPRRIARSALEALGSHRSAARRLSVRCRRGHRVATVYTTPAGPVYVSVTGPHAHGARDFVDTAHHAASAGRELVDLLEREALVDDALPASCECGPHVLSRKVLLQALAEGSRRILVG